jgi:hypothetical protein
MKKTLLILSALVVISLVSCKKDHSCSCSEASTVTRTDYYDDGGTQGADVTTFPTVESSYIESLGKTTKRDGDKQCDGYTGTSESSIGATITVNGIKNGTIEKTTTVTTCTLQ